jgi:hypothetical protein
MSKLSLVLVLSCLLALPTLAAVTEEELIQCKTSADCIVVPYKHCCGSSKRAINKKHKLLYESKPEWQKFTDPGKCAKIGMCVSDQHVSEAKCAGETILQCVLKFP